jgi:hypothetical protein
VVLIAAVQYTAPQSTQHDAVKPHIPGSRVLIEKIPGSLLVKIFPAFFGTQKFITACTSAHNLSLP